MSKIRKILNIFTVDIYKKPVPKVVPEVVSEKCRTTPIKVISLKRYFEINPEHTLEITELQKESNLYNTFVEFLESNVDGKKLPTNKFIEDQLGISLKKIKELKQKACENEIIIKVSNNKYVYNINRNDKKIIMM